MDPGILRRVAPIEWPPPEETEDLPPPPLYAPHGRAPMTAEEVEEFFMVKRAEVEGFARLLRNRAFDLVRDRLPLGALVRLRGKGDTLAERARYYLREWTDRFVVGA